jgi:hypothetical protein
MTPEQIANLPDVLLSASHPYAQVTLAQMSGLLTEAAQRICDLEEQLLKAQGDANFYKARVDKLRSAIVGHRGQRDWYGGKIQADLTLWQMVNDVPWGERIKGDG